MNSIIHSPIQLSTHLKSLRKARKLTQEQLGALIGVKQTRMADIEKNPGAVNVAQLLAVLHALDTRMLLASADEVSADVSPGAADW
jgi:HTH-type transcriptional regulator/antitoxin HipB